MMMVDKEATEEGCGSRRALIVVCSTDHKRLALITPVVCSTVRGTTCRLQAWCIYVLPGAGVLPFYIVFLGSLELTVQSVKSQRSKFIW